MHKPTNRITYPRHLDARTAEGRRFRKKVGNEAQAKARRDFKTSGSASPKAFHGAGTTARKVLDTVKASKLATPEVPPTVKAKPFNWSAGASPTLAQIDADIAYREEVLNRIKGLRDILASMEARITAIAAG